MNQKLQTIKVYTVQRCTRMPCLIDAVVYGEFAVHPTLGLWLGGNCYENPFTVTHVPTGAVVLQFYSERLAHEFAIELMNLDADWSYITQATKDIPENCRTIVSTETLELLLDVDRIQPLREKYNRLDNQYEENVILEAIETPDGGMDS